jgi:hypothetical protein
MKELSDRDKVLKGLKYIGKKTGIDGLNFMLTEHKFISSSRRNFYLQYFVLEKITDIIIVDKDKLKELEKVRRTGREQVEVIPHSRVTEDFLDVLITSMQKSKRDNFFDYERNQLFLIADEKCRKPVEKVLRQMGLKIIYFRGILN